MKKIKDIKQSIRREILSLCKASLYKFDDCDPTSLDIEPSITQDMIIDQYSVDISLVKSTVQEQLSDPFKLNDLIKTTMSGVECLRIYDHFDSKSNGKKSSSFRTPSRDVKRQRNRHKNRVVSNRQTEREKREEAAQNRHRRKDQQKVSSKRVSFVSSSFERFVKPKYKEKVLFVISFFV
jgi:hypothetical protein